MAKTVVPIMSWVAPATVARVIAPLSLIGLRDLTTVTDGLRLLVNVQMMLWPGAAVTPPGIDVPLPDVIGAVLRWKEAFA